MNSSPLRFMGNVVKSTEQKAAEILVRVPGANIISHVWGYDPNPSNTEHHSGLAADFMLYDSHGQIDTALGDRIFAYAWLNRKRLGVQHIIWEQSIISTVVSPGVRRPMADRGNATNNHRDHVHILFFNTAYVAPTPAALPKAKYPGRLITMGARGATVTLIQRIVGASPDGIYGPRTKAAVVIWQSKHKLSPDGIVGPKTFAKMFP